MAKNIGVLTFAVSKAGVVPLSNLVSVLRSGDNSVYLITDDHGYEHFKNNADIHVCNIEHKSHPNGFINMLSYMHKQALIAYKILKDLRHVDTWIFFFNSDTMVIPLITLKLLGKKTILALPSSSEKIHAYASKNLVTIIKTLSNTSYRLADRIILYSPGLITEWNLSKYRDKIRIAHEHYINFDEFKLTTDVGSRPEMIGFIGRLDAEKGIMNFIEAIPEILGSRPDARFMIIGDGNQKEMAQKFVEENRIGDRVKLAGWVPHSELPSHLNTMKLLVIPSYTEGLPNTMLEAMACGTPVLANAVGSIPDYIKDGDNGFIMENNSSECIARHVKQILGRSDLENMGLNGKRTAEAEFSYEVAVNKYMQAIK
jgi:glycosyltransferase involved in cell wall biosynthesis